jgi:hypothetical protein
LLLCLAFFLQFESRSDKVELVPLDNLSNYPGMHNGGGKHFKKSTPWVAIQKMHGDNNEKDANSTIISGSLDGNRNV